MNRLQSEFHRLYLVHTAEPRVAEHNECMPETPSDTRAMVLELTGPADWNELSKVWRAVQAELGLPAPAIAVSGSDGLQLWFSLQAPVSGQRAVAFLSQLRAHYLPGVAPGRVRLLPSDAEGQFSLPIIPKQSGSTGNWSAFVAPDLAAVFGDTPSLDVEPGADGQADLLARLESINPIDFDTAMQRLSPSSVSRTSLGQASRASAGRRTDGLVDREQDVDPKRFLQRVLNDESVELALRIEAAKALLLNC